ncbi:MAG TPA: ROK family protein [Candidatus Dormibacteraeota bacterium]|nr:ROK family protein [Candidatus Dormibacteraeota bacterium]
MSEALAGVDVGGTKIQVVITSGEMEVLGQSRGPTPPAGGPAAVVEALCSLLDQARREAGADGLAAVGVGAPGTIDKATGVVAHSPNLAGWIDPYPLGAELRRRTGAPVSVDNDVHAAMLGELRLGAARGLGDVLGVWFGTGVGGALVLGGELRSGPRGASGEIGHVCVKDGGRRCGCGRRGCLEAYAGRASMERRARKLVAEGRRTDLFRIMEQRGLDHLTSGVLSRALTAGDDLAQDLIDEAVVAAGCGIASVVNVLDVEAVIVGGGLGSRLGEPFVSRVAAAMQPHLFVTPAVSVRLTALGDLGGALGAACAAADLGRGAG